ncbi:hypothetical protein ACFXGT_11485 [Streptomyces sp. NPDC059352]|uniref:hypothetical protein n=1 Tax=Streptomyces sp. NPDC059352 TaxID=3346810 RepID=UPI003692DF7F
MTGRLTPERLAEIFSGRYAYRTSEQLARDIRDLLAEREQLLVEAARGKGTASRGESTPAPHRADRAEVRFAVHGPVVLLNPVVRDLEPDYYGHPYAQLGGWLPDSWGDELPHGTEYLEFAHLPGQVMPCEINVQVSTRTRDGSRYMSIEWRRDHRPTAQRSGGLGRTA